MQQNPEFEVAYLEAAAEGWDRLEHAARQEAMPHDTVVEEMGIVTDRRGNAILDQDGNPRMLVTRRTKKRECNPTLMMFLLKSHDPARYRDRYDVEMSGKGGGPLTLAFIDEIVVRADGKSLEERSMSVPAALAPAAIGLPAGRTADDGMIDLSLIDAIVAKADGKECAGR